MKKLYTRIAACSLAVLIAFNTVAIPKVEAVITESALVSAFVATYSAAAGFAYRGELFPGTEQMPAVVRSIETFIEDFAEAREMTRAQFEEEINAGVEFIGDGVVKIGSAAAGLLGSFTDWLVDKFGLIGEDGNPVATPVQVGAYVIHLADGSIVPYVPYSLIDCVDNSDYDMTAYYLQTPYKDLLFTSGYKLLMADGRIFCYDPSGVQIGSGYEMPLSPKCLFIRETSEGKIGVSAVLSSGQWWNTADFSDFDTVVGSTSYSISLGTVQLDPDYEAAPTVDEQYAMVIDTGMTIEDEQDFVDSVLGAMLAGTLAPTYTIENTAGGDVVVPDEDEETNMQAGILSTVKNIAQNVIALPQTIADKFAAFPQTIAEAVGKLFAPDAALTQEITDTFSAKFDFISNLHGLGVDLLNLDPSQTPPVIYIHLENADSNYGFAYGGTTKALDMAWYEPYKEDVDRIISGFLWLGFLWLCFMRASDIINGAGMVYAAGQPTIYTPDSLHDAPRLEAPRWRRRGR